MRKLLMLMAGLMGSLSVCLADISVELKSASFNTALRADQSQSSITIKTSDEGWLLVLDYKVTCGGITTEESLDLFDLNQTYDYTYTLPITYKVPATAGRYATTVEITGINYSDPNGTTLKASGNTTVVDRAEKRYSLVEEYTGTECGNCPRGWLGMKHVKEEASDIAGVIAIHQYNVSDPMYTANYLTPYYTGAPACWLDRSLYPDPLEGANEEGIIATLRQHNEQNLPSVVCSNLRASYNADKSAVEVESDTEFLTDGTGYSIAYVLTADGLTSASRNWLQKNYFNEESAWMMNMLYPGLGMEIFGKGGQYGTDPVQLVYDDVLIGSTWQPYGNSFVSSVAFTPGATSGSTQHTSGQVAMPTKQGLLSAIYINKVYATVIVLDQTGRVANAARCRVEESTGVEAPSILPLKGETASPVYTLDGRKIHNAPQGLYIQGGHKIVKGRFY